MKYLKTYESDDWHVKYVERSEDPFFSKEDIEDILISFKDEDKFEVKVEKYSPIEWGKAQNIRYGYDHKFEIKIDCTHPNYHWNYNYDDQSILTEDMFENLHRLVNTLTKKGWDYEARVAYSSGKNDGMSNIERTKDILIRDGFIEAKLIQDRSIIRLEPGDGIFYMKLEFTKWS